MSEGLLCPECRWVGKEPDSHREQDKVDDGPARIVVVETCPDCGHDELVEITLCSDCLACGVEKEGRESGLCREHEVGL